MGLFLLLVTLGCSGKNRITRCLRLFVQFLDTTTTEEQTFDPHFSFGLDNFSIRDEMDNYFQSEIPTATKVTCRTALVARFYNGASLVPDDITNWN
jgi:hypothetical protein